MFTEP